MSQFYGTHLLVDFSCRNGEKLNSLSYLDEFFGAICAAGSFTVVKKDSYQFTPQGISMYYILSESHCSVHSWPELGKAALDVFCCRKLSSETIQNISNLLERFFDIEDKVCHTIYRGSLDAMSKEGDSFS